MKYLFVALMGFVFSDCEPRMEPGVVSAAVAEQIGQPAGDTLHNQPLKMLTYGLQAGGYREGARRDIAKKYGFSYYVVAGCVVTEQLVDSVRTVNARTTQAIALIHGRDWEARFEKEVATLTDRYTRATRLVAKQPWVIEKLSELEKQKQYADLDAREGSTKDQIIIDMYYFSWQQEKGRKIVYRAFTVDLSRSSVSVADDRQRIYDL